MQAGVPEAFRKEQTKGQFALELLDQVRGEGRLPGDLVITDAAYGVSHALRDGLAQRGLFYIVGSLERRTDEWPPRRPDPAEPRP